MELLLEQFIEDVEVITNIHGQNKNPIMYRAQNGATNKSLVFFCGYDIPRYVVLPINAIYIDYNPESPTYRTAFKRILKDKNPFKDQWKALYFYDEAMADQSYDPSDLSVVSPEPPPIASYLTHGVGFLSFPQKDSHVLVDGDDTLSNKRDPLDHDEMHPEIPASMVSINGSAGGQFTPIMDQTEPRIGQLLVHRENTYQWSKLQEGELEK